MQENMHLAAYSELKKRTAKDAYDAVILLHDSGKTEAEVSQWLVELGMNPAEAGAFVRACLKRMSAHREAVRPAMKHFIIAALAGLAGALTAGAAAGLLGIAIGTKIFIILMIFSVSAVSYAVRFGALGKKSSGFSVIAAFFGLVCVLFAHFIFDAGTIPSPAGIIESFPAYVVEVFFGKKMFFVVLFVWVLGVIISWGKANSGSDKK